MQCLFCRIVSGDLPASMVYEDEDLVVFNDINPQAPMHVLVVPRRHVATLNDLAAGLIYQTPNSQLPTPN